MRISDWSSDVCSSDLSTTANGKHSKIVPSLEGVPVSTARTDIDVVVTEQGVASLRGLDLEARRRALIGVAHPAFREMLERAAMEGPDAASREESGSAAGRVRGCQDGELSGGAVSVKTKNTKSQST